MEIVVSLLMERYSISRREAVSLIHECKQEYENGNYDAVHEILGLEDMYLDFLL